jgi:cytochrome P450 PksS
MEVSLRSASFQDDPYTTLDTWRSRQPVFSLDPLPGWLVLSYDHFAESLSSPLLSTDPRITAFGNPDTVREKFPFLGWFLEVSGPFRHDSTSGHPLKQFAHSFFSGNSNKTLLSVAIENSCNLVFTGLAEAPLIDIYRDLGIRIASATMSNLLGFEDGSSEHLANLSLSLLQLQAPARNPLRVLAIDRAIAAAHKLFSNALACSTNQTPPLISALVRMLNHEEVERDEVLHFLVSLIAAGIDTVANSISYAIFNTLSMGATRDLLTWTFENRWKWVREYLRLRPFTILIPRYARQSCHLFDMFPVERGDVVWLSPAAAFRDPGTFPRPTEFLPERDLRRVPLFGAHPHHCVGAGLAKLETTMALSSFCQRFPSVNLQSHGRILSDFSTIRLEGTLIARA